MKPLPMSIPPRLRRYLKAILKEGLTGQTERQVAIRLLEERLREWRRSK